jgi:hypothetical protein
MMGCSVPQPNAAAREFAGMPLAVGTPVTRRPRHGPGRAVFPHPVLRLYSRARRTDSTRLLLPAVRLAHVVPAR